MKNKKNKNKNKNKKKRAPDPPEYLRPNSFVPRAPKGTHAGEGSLASEKVSLPTNDRHYDLPIFVRNDDFRLVRVTAIATCRFSCE